jgi:single-strand DNA-binding protein
MAKSVNKVILVGNVGQDPEVKYTASGVPVAKVSLATNERFKDRNDQWQDKTEWHSVVAWQRLAEIVGEYVRKGSKLYVEGKLQTSTWEDRQNGGKKYRTEIVARDIVLLGSRDNRQEGREKCPANDLARRLPPSSRGRHFFLRSTRSVETSPFGRATDRDGRTPLLLTPIPAVGFPSRRLLDISFKVSNHKN